MTELSPTSMPHSNDIPLAERMRPKSFDDLVGQSHLFSKTSAFRTMIESDGYFNILLWGPAGTGKTSVAQIVALTSRRKLITLSAVSASVKDIRQAIDTSKCDLQEGNKANVLFIDEIHRLSKNQQDVLLPALESGDVRFIGATTENPSFTVNHAILSRSLTFTLKPLDPKELTFLILRSLKHPSLTAREPKIDDDALIALTQASDGDARRAFHLLESALTLSKHITIKTIEELSLSSPLRYDRAGDAHYDVISAFIKSIRASHPDAAIYYLARMLESGEDCEFVARRLLIAASEDIGNANPMALVVAESTFQAVRVLGMPEARIPLAQCTTYLASSPKSNRSYVAINEALADAKSQGSLEIPMHLRNAPTKFMKEAGYSAGYRYAHDDLAGARGLTYLPDKLLNKKYYNPIPVGAERQLIENLKQLRPTQD
jgi:putative ATPase